MFHDSKYDPVELPLTSEAVVLYVGEHRGLRWEIRYSRMEAGSPRAVSTYVCLSEAQYEAFRAKVEEAPWNGYVSYRKRLTYECVEFDYHSFTQMVMGGDVKDRWGRPHRLYKFGDDFQHEWDRNPPSPDCMKRHIQDVIDYLYSADEED